MQIAVDGALDINGVSAGPGHMAAEEKLYRAYHWLNRELAGRVDVSLIGDAANPDSILAAVHQGFHVARSL